MMSAKLKYMLPCALAAATAATVPAHAVTDQIQVLTAGSSAQYGVFAAAAYQLALAQGGAKHYTVKSGQCAAPGCAFLDDSARNANIPNEPANLWVVWSETTGNIWAYASVDSVVGDRSFLAVPRATLGLAASLPLSSTTNLAVFSDGTPDSALDPGVLAAITGAPLTAANTDIRPEDALYATNRDLHALDTAAYGGFGYENPALSSGSCEIGFSYVGNFSSSIATAVSFALTGNDPCSHKPTVPYVTIPIGAAPVVVIANTEDAAGLGNNDVTTLNVTRFGLNRAYQLWGGAICNATPVGGSSTVPVFPILREPTSGTYNTFEFTNIRIASNNHIHSQENNVGTTQGAPFNPLNLACTTGGGSRLRAIGTGDVVKGVNTTEDAIGYVFFSYEALPPSDVNLKYITLDGVDPLHSAYFHGAIPTCGTSSLINCSLPPGHSFPGLRNGTYRSWSIYRIVTDAAGNAAASTLVSEAQAIVNTTLPDFVPFAPVCGSSAADDEPGLKVYRQHYTQEGIAPGDGALQPAVTCTVGGSRTLAYGALGGNDSSFSETGGDVGGTIEYTPTGSPVPPGPTGGID